MRLHSIKLLSGNIDDEEMKTFEKIAEERVKRQTKEERRAREREDVVGPAGEFAAAVKDASKLPNTTSAGWLP